MAEWQRGHDYPMTFTTEASMDLAQHPDLIAAMVKANFWSVFIGIESPSRESLTETKKFQNLREDPLQCIKRIQREGLWVTGGFIVGFDSDTEDIFERQVEFIERGAIAWAMTGFLQALPTTPLYERLAREGRLIDTRTKHGNFKPPNFRTMLPLPVAAGGRAAHAALDLRAGRVLRAGLAVARRVDRPGYPADAGEVARVHARRVPEIHRETGHPVVLPPALLGLSLPADPSLAIQPAEALARVEHPHLRAPFHSLRAAGLLGARRRAAVAWSCGARNRRRHVRSRRLAYRARRFTLVVKRQGAGVERRDERA